jgi:hypothetical protein
MLRISPGEQFETLVADGNPVALMSGPDEKLGLFGGPTGPGIDTGDQPVMRIEPSEMPGPIRKVPATLIKPAAADPEKAVKQRHFILDSSMSADPGLAGPHAASGRLMCINGKTHDRARINEKEMTGVSFDRLVVSCADAAEAAARAGNIARASGLPTG